MSRADHLLLIQVPITGKFGTEHELASLRDLEDKIEERLNLTRYGEVDGDEIGAGEWSLFVVGRSVQRLWDSLSDVIISHGLPAGSRASLRRYSAVWGQPDKIIPLTGPKAGTPIQRAKLSAHSGKHQPRPGDLYAVALPSGGIGVCILTAITTAPGLAPYACVYGLGRFFERQPSPPLLATLSPTACTYLTMVSTRVLSGKGFARIGGLRAFDAGQWPIPIFSWGDEDGFSRASIHPAILPRPFLHEPCRKAESLACPPFDAHESARPFVDGFDMAIRRITPRLLGDEQGRPRHIDVQRGQVDRWRKVQQSFANTPPPTPLHERKLVEGSVAAFPMAGGGFGIAVCARTGRGLQGAIVFGLNGVYPRVPDANVVESVSIRNLAVPIHSISAVRWPAEWYPLGRVPLFQHRDWPLPPSLDRPYEGEEVPERDARMLIYNQRDADIVVQRTIRRSERRDMFRLPDYSGTCALHALCTWVHLSVRLRRTRFRLLVDDVTLSLWEKINAEAARPASPGAKKRK